MYGGYRNSVLDSAELDSAAISAQGSVLEIMGLGRLDWGLPILIDECTRSNITHGYRSIALYPKISQPVNQTKEKLPCIQLRLGRLQTLAASNAFNGPAGGLPQVLSGPHLDHGTRG